MQPAFIERNGGQQPFRHAMGDFGLTRGHQAGGAGEEASRAKGDCVTTLCMSEQPAARMPINSTLIAARCQRACGE
jgi:hypothetical protein